MTNNKKGRIIAFVGMPGSGKSEAADFLRKKSIPTIRFGDLTDETLEQMGLSITPENERMVREKWRKELGMAAYAIKAKSKIDSLLKQNQVIGLDGLRSWEEYILLKKEYDDLVVVAIYTEPEDRYQRLMQREIRPVPIDKSRARDISELEQLNMGGPIAIADYTIENSGEDLTDLYNKIDRLLIRLQIK